MKLMMMLFISVTTEDLPKMRLSRHLQEVNCPNCHQPLDQSGLLFTPWSEHKPPQPQALAPTHATRTPERAHTQLVVEVVLVVGDIVIVVKDPPDILPMEVMVIK